MAKANKRLVRSHQAHKGLARAGTQAHDIGHARTQLLRAEKRAANFLDQTRPIPTPAMASRLPVAWRTGISEALENKYLLAKWAGMPQGIYTFDLLTDMVGPGAERLGRDAERSRMARTFFQMTCLEAPLYYCSESVTNDLMKAAEVLEDWTPMPELLPHQNGLVIMFERGVFMQAHKMGRFTDADKVVGITDPREMSTKELRGLVITRIFFGTHAEVVEDPMRVEADEIAFAPHQFSARVKNWTERIHVSGLSGGPGISMPLPHDLAGWNVGLSLGQHRRQFDGYEGMGQMVWRAEDELEAKLLGAILLFVKQRIVVHSTRKADRATRKRVEGMQVGRDRPDANADIMLIELRARDYVTERAEGDAEPVEWSCRWLVRPHWHKYRCGEARSVVQSKWVGAYIKGPAGKPLKQPQAQVFAVVR